jgi:hypothetical protein
MVNKQEAEREQWFAHASEARTMAEQMNDPFEKETLLRIAEGFEQIAKSTKEQPGAELTPE